MLKVDDIIVICVNLFVHHSSDWILLETLLPGIKSKQKKQQQKNHCFYVLVTKIRETMFLNLCLPINEINSLWPSNVLWRWRFRSKLAWWHQAITWTDVDFSIVRFRDIHIRAISQWGPKPHFCIMNLNILLRILKKYTATSPRPNEWRCFVLRKKCSNSTAIYSVTIIFIG